jgi:hypothetical protein
MFLFIPHVFPYFSVPSRWDKGPPHDEFLFGSQSSGDVPADEGSRMTCLVSAMTPGWVMNRVKDAFG